LNGFGFVHFNADAKVIPVYYIKKEKRIKVLKRHLEVYEWLLNSFAEEDTGKQKI